MERNRRTSKGIRPIKLMEVCGSHTMAIAKYGIKQLLPDKIKLISGPGCPVCVTPIEDIDNIIDLAKNNVCIATFGDLIRVPGSRSTLAEERAKGRDIKVVYSPLDALKLAEFNPQRQVVFVGIGFETTAPGVALSIIYAKKQKIENYSVLCLHKMMPPALNSLLESGAEIDGFLLPGHVCSITGSRPFEFLPEKYGVPGVVSGFEAKDILESIALLTKNLADPKVEIQYKRAVKPEGNRKAQDVMEEVFEAVDAVWRGLGPIKDSGLAIRDEWSSYDAAKKFGLKKNDGAKGYRRDDAAIRDSGTIDKIKFYSKCRCGEVLKGAMDPPGCPLFGKTCTPEHPIGPCMVSSEGSCAAYYKYGR